MAKKIKTVVKLQITAGKANPAPPVGSALGPHGIQIQDFCNQFNGLTKELGDAIVPCEITIFEDRSFTFITKVSPAQYLIKKAAGLNVKGGGSGKPNLTKVGKLTRTQLRQVAETKMKDLNANDVDAAMKIIAGTARSMGVTIED